MPVRPRPTALFAVPVLAALTVLTAGLLGGCTANDWDAPHAAPTAIGEPGSGFLPADPPSPEATVEPRAGSWDGVSPSAGMRVLLLSAGDEAEVTTLTDAVRSWAAAESVDLRQMRVADGDDPVAVIVGALDQHPDLIVSAGNDLVDPLAAVTPSHLDQQFLVIGAELAEPTGNVTAVDWTGAAFRGEGLGTASHYDPASFTAERADRAVRAGATAVLTGSTGIVLWID